VKSIWALVAVLNEIRAQLVRLNLNMEAGRDDLSRRFGESDYEYWGRLSKHNETAKLPPGAGRG
jgi:hypothetical protein